MALFAILKTGLEDKATKGNNDKRARLRLLPSTISDAIRLFQASDYTTKILGTPAKEKYLEYKKIVRDRNPRELGNSIKAAEIIYHHEVTNQFLWNKF